jgi:hypothetical protein
MCYDWQYPFRLIWLRPNNLTAPIDRRVVIVCCIEMLIVGSSHTCSSIHFSKPDLLNSVRISDCNRPSRYFFESINLPHSAKAG